MTPDAYCREVEAHLCRKNDGHLIRIVGPAFERVTGWARQGIPLRVALAGIDRCFERYYRKGPRRRPVHVEFCDADVLDAFDEWRRAVGVSGVAADPETGAAVEEPVPAAGRRRRSLRTHVDTVISRLTALRGSERPGGAAAEAAIDAAVCAIEPLRGAAEHARGDARQALVDALAAADRALIEALARAAPGPQQAAWREEAARELEPFRARMTDEVYRQAHAAAVARLVRETYGVPEIVP